MNTFSKTQSYSIILQLRVSDRCAALTSWLPQENNIATAILADALQQALWAAGLQTAIATGGGPLNASLYTFRVDDVHRALAVIQAKLDNFALISFATIHWYDEREQFMRPVRHGASVNPEAPLDLHQLGKEIEEHQRHTQTRLELFLALNASLSLKTPPAPGQP
jgi:hypothetical protein